MTVLLEVRDTLRRFYSNFDVYLKPLMKFAFALLTVLLIQGYIGYLPLLGRMPVILFAALFCSVMPWSASALVAAVFVLGNMAQLSLIMAVVAFMMMLVIAVLYFGFKPGNAYLMVLIPLAFFLKVPFLMPVVLGLSVGAMAVFPAACAIPVWFLIRYFHDNAAGLSQSTELSDITQEFTAVMNGVLRNEYMYLMILTFAVCILLVSIIKKLSIDHAWTIAIIAGIAAEAVLGVGGGLLTGGGNLIFDLPGLIASLGLALLYEYLFFGVDYTGTQKLQFEDDDYYYYVKAVPKIKPYDEDERGE